MPFVWNTFAIGAWSGGSWALAWSMFALGLIARLLPLCGSGPFVATVREFLLLPHR